MAGKDNALLPSSVLSQNCISGGRWVSPTTGWDLVPRSRCCKEGKMKGKDQWGGLVKKKKKGATETLEDGICDDNDCRYVWWVQNVGKEAPSVFKSYVQLLYTCFHRYQKFDPIFISEQCLFYTHSHNYIRFQGLMLCWRIEIAWYMYFDRMFRIPIILKKNLQNFTHENNNQFLISCDYVAWLDWPT